MKWFLIVVVIFSFLSTFVFAGPGNGGHGRPGNHDNVFRIQIGNNNEYDMARLARRVFELERAVSQLQARVFSLEISGPVYPEPSSRWICSIRDTFNGGLHTGEIALTKMQAEQNAYSACLRRYGAMFCSGSFQCEMTR